VANQHPQHDRDDHRVARVVEEAYGDEIKHEGVRRAPEPEILMQDEKSSNYDHQQRSLHSVLLVAIVKMSAYYGISPKKIATGSRGC
jgi:hypothetical protein